MALALLLGGLGQLLVRMHSQQEEDSHRLDREDRLGQAGQPQPQPQPHQEITSQGCTTSGVLLQFSKIQRLVQTTFKKTFGTAHIFMRHFIVHIYLLHLTVHI